MILDQSLEDHSEESAVGVKQNLRVLACERLRDDVSVISVALCTAIQNA